MPVDPQIQKLLSIDPTKLKRNELIKLIPVAMAVNEAISTRKHERFVPQEYQLTFFASKKKFIALFAGNRAGKTMSAICYLVKFIMGTLPNRKTPNWPLHIRISSVDYATLERVHIPMFREFMDHRELKGGSWDTAVRRTGGVITRIDLKSGGWVEFKTHEQSVESYQAVQLDAYLMDEACKNREIWVENRMRLVDRGGFGMHTLSPLTDITWETEIEESANDEETASDFDFFRWDSRWNKYLKKEELDRLMRDLTSEEIQMRIMGIAAKMGNRVYWTFKRDRNIIKPFAIPAHWPRVVIFDCHDTKAHAVDWFAVDTEDDIYHYRAIKKKCQIPELAKTVRALSGTEPIALMLLDPSATKVASNRAVDDKSFFMQLLDAGLDIQMGIVGEKAAHIVKVCEYMKPDSMTGKPRYQVFDTLEAPRYVEPAEWPPINEIEHYIYIRNRESEARKDSMKVRDKYDDHCVNIRMICAAEPQFKYLLPLNRSAKRASQNNIAGRFKFEVERADNDYHATNIPRPQNVNQRYTMSDYE